MTSGASGGASRTRTSIRAWTACTSCSSIGCGRNPTWWRLRSRVCGRCRATSTPDGQTCGRNWCPTSCSIGPSTRRARVRHYTRNLLADQVSQENRTDWPRRAPRGRCLRCVRRVAGGAAARGQRRLGVRRGALRRGAARCRAARLRARALRERGRQRDRAASTEHARLRATSYRAPRTGTHSLAGAQRGPSGARPRTCVVGYEDWTGAAACLPAREGAGQLPARRGVQRRAVAAVPAAGAGRGVIPVAPPVLRRRCAATSSCPSRPTAPARRRSPSGSGVELPTRAIPTTSRPRGLPGPPLAPGHGQAQPDPPCGRSSARSYFAEGWALYAERMMREHGFYPDPRQEMYQYEATLFRAARIVVDTSLHIGEMTHAGGGRVHAGALVHDRADRPRRGDALLLVADPGVSSYLTGCLEILRIRDRVPGSPRDDDRRHRRPARLPRRDHRRRHAADRPGRARGDGPA